MTKRFSGFTLRAVVCAICATGFGCPLFLDLDSIPLEEAAADMGDAEPDDMEQPSDATTVPDDMNGTDGDMSVDPDMPIDTGNNANPGTCIDDPGELLGECDPVAQDCPGNSEFCDIRIVNSDFATVCGPLTAANYVLDDGDPCEPNDTVDKCKVGLICRVANCASLCRLDDASGCDNDEVCTPIANQIAEYGVCSSTCD